MKYGLLVIAFILVVLGCAGSSDSEDEEKMQEYNESMCRDKAYPKGYCDKQLKLSWGELS